VEAVVLETLLAAAAQVALSILRVKVLELDLIQ
jgi:hypothetical protein